MSEKVEDRDDNRSLEEIYNEKLAAVQAKLDSADVGELEALTAEVAEIDALKKELDDELAAAGELDALKDRIKDLEQVEDDAAEEVVEQVEEDAAEEVVEQVQEDDAAEEVVEEEEKVETEDKQAAKKEKVLVADEIIDDNASFGILSPQSSFESSYASYDEFVKKAFEAYPNTKAGSEGETIYIGKIKSDEPDVTLTKNAGQDLINISKSFEKYNNNVEEFNASICACQSFDVLRDIPSFCNAGSGLFSLPRVAVDRGGIIYQLPSNACGATFDTFTWDETCDPNAPAQPDKPCQVVPCGTEEEAVVQAFGWCAVFGNGFARFNPEQLAYWIGEGQCNFEFISAQRLLDLVLTHPRLVTQTEACAIDDCVSGYASLRRILSVKASQIRSDLQNESLRLEITVPTTLRDAIQLDRAAANEGGSLESIAADLNLGIQYVSHWQKFPVGDTGCDYPSDFTVLMNAPGVFRELDGGELDFGLVRDSVLNAQNQVKIQYERWNGVGHFGPDCSAKLLNISGLNFTGLIAERQKTAVCAAI